MEETYADMRDAGRYVRVGVAERFTRSVSIEYQRSVIFVCDLCECEFRTEGNRKTHRLTCNGGLLGIMLGSVVGVGYG